MRKGWGFAIGIGAAIALCGCVEEELPPNVLRFEVDHPLGQEGFFCFRYERPEFAGKNLRGFRWQPPEDTSLQLHHAVLYALFGVRPEDESSRCGLSNGVGTQVHAWAPGGDLFAFPPGVAYQLPANLDRFDIDAHVLRLAEGPAQTAQVTLDITDEPAEHTVGLFKGAAPVPTLPPHETTTSVMLCRMEDTAHVVGVWPHMHVAGIEFRGDLIRANGERETLVHLDPWDWHNQRIHPLDVEFRPGDKIETTCVWANPTPEPILPGGLTTEEMCEQTFFAYPPEAARCKLEY
jgi:hypothetical protein